MRMSVIHPLISHHYLSHVPHLPPLSSPRQDDANESMGPIAGVLRQHPRRLSSAYLVGLQYTPIGKSVRQIGTGIGAWHTPTTRPAPPPPHPFLIIPF